MNFGSVVGMEKAVGRFICAVLVLYLLSGCAGTAKDRSPIFFPPLPDKPRVQFLKGIRQSSDVEDNKSLFSLFMTGREELENDKYISKPYGVQVHDGKIYICDIGPGNLVIVDPKQKTFGYLKGNASIGKLKKPANSATDSDGNLYVADAGRGEVLIYGKSGEFLKAFGKEVGMKPADVMVDKEYVYVLDLKSDEIKLFKKKDTKFAYSIGKATEEQKGLSLPTNMAMDKKGLIYVTNTRAAKVMKLDRDGHLLQSIGQHGDLLGEFARPKGIAVDDAGRIFVVDGGHQNVQIFNEQGQLLMLFGEPGSGEAAMDLPTGIAVSRDNLDYYQSLAAPGFILESVLFVANQYGPNKLAIYGLGQMTGSEGQDPAAAQGAGVLKDADPSQKQGK